MRTDQDPTPPAHYLIRFSGLVGEELLGTISGLVVTRAPACTILHIQSEGSAADIVEGLHSRGLDILSFRRIG